MSNAFDLEAYLRRIGYDGPLGASLATLSALKTAHLETIPFEAIDPLLRRPVSLDLDDLQQKIVRGKRGGYCFEVNMLLQRALEAIGFAVTPLAARVTWNSGLEAPLGPLTHMLLKVETEEGPQIVDVGFGGCLVDAPLPFRLDELLPTPLGDFRVTRLEGRLALSVRRAEAWRTLYVFDLARQLPADYGLANFYTSNTGRLARTLTLERIGQGRRFRIVNRSYRIEARHGAVESERAIADGGDLGRLLEEAFGVTPPIPPEELFARTPTGAA